MNKEKLKEPYESVTIKLILFEFSDLITTSGDSDTTVNWGDIQGDGWS